MSNVEVLDDHPPASEFEAFLNTHQAVLEAMPMAVCVCASDGRIVRFNARAVGLWGRTPNPADQERFCGSFRLYGADATPIPHGDGPMATVLSSGEPVQEREMIVERSDGSRAFVLASFEPLKSRAGRVQGAIAFLQDITARKQMEQRLQQSEEHHRQILDALPNAVYTTDANGIVTYVNRAAAELAGREPELGKDKWCVTWQLQSTDGKPLPYDECPMAVALKEARPVRGEEAVALRPDGTSFAFIPYPTPIFDADGKLSGAVNMMVDITERKAVEEQRGQLVAELSHRVKNTLATVISIGRQSFANPDTAEARRAFDARIRALAQTHTRLAESNWAGASLETMLFDELAPYRQLRGENLSLKGPDVMLGPKCALTLGMAFHELAMNAGKYGALSTKEGRVDISWDVDTQDRRLILSWIESGGPPVEPPARRGFGRLLLEKVLAADLKGDIELRFERLGLSCSIAIPLDRQLVLTPAEH
jgi:PAS domain S-box-containing protein